MMERTHLFQSDRSELAEAAAFGIGDFGGVLLEQAFFPLLLLDKVFAQVLAAGAAILDVDVARAKLFDIVALLHHITPQDTLTTMALQAGLHSVVTSVPLHNASDNSTACAVSASPRNCWAFSILKVAG